MEDRNKNLGGNANWYAFFLHTLNKTLAPNWRNNPTVSCVYSVS